MVFILRTSLPLGLGSSTGIDRRFNSMLPLVRQLLSQRPEVARVPYFVVIDNDLRQRRPRSLRAFAV
jgi:hypothetical protein